MKCAICGRRGTHTGIGFDLCRDHRELAINIAKDAVKAYVHGAKMRWNATVQKVNDLVQDSNIDPERDLG